METFCLIVLFLITFMILSFLTFAMVVMNEMTIKNIKENKYYSVEQCKIEIIFSFFYICYIMLFLIDFNSVVSSSFSILSVIGVISFYRNLYYVSKYHNKMKT